MHPLRPGHQVALLHNGKSFFPALVQEIDRSIHEVRLETYIFDFDASGLLVAAALVRAAQRGVQVYMVIDGVGTPELPLSWARQFDAAGVNWRIFLPMGRLGLLLPSRWRRMHRKLCVVDGWVAFCGGINVLDDFQDPNYGALSQPRFDFSVRVTGPLVQKAHEATAQFWWRLQTARNVRSRDFAAVWQSIQDGLQLALQGVSGDELRGNGKTTGHSAKADLLLRDNLLNRSRIERAYRKAIGEARHEIIIANAYFLPGRKLRQALILAARRGVKVRLLLQGRYEYFMPYHAVWPVYAGLLAAGIEIHEYAPSFLHAKVAVIDGHWATVGSSNLDPLSLLLAREANVVVEDALFARELRGHLEQAMAHDGRRVDPAAYAQRPWRLRVLDRLAFGLMRLALFLTGCRY
jgi:cardiolipin synthase